MKFKLKTIGIAFAAAFAAVSGLTSCTSPSDKAGKIVKGMDENSSLLYVDTYGETPCVITYTPDDSVGNIVRHNLKEGKVDTLPQPFIYSGPARSCLSKRVILSSAVFLKMRQMRSIFMRRASLEILSIRRLDP